MEDEYRFDQVVMANSGNFHCLVENHDTLTIPSLGLRDGEEKDDDHDCIEVRAAYPGWVGGTLS